MPDPDPLYQVGLHPPGVHTRTEISDYAFRSLYQLHYLWAREEGRNIDDQAWAEHYAALVVSGAVIPILAQVGRYAIGCADVTLFKDPFTSKAVGYADHAWIHPVFRGEGAFAGIMNGCVNIGRLMGVDRAIIPSRPDLVEAYQRCAARFGWAENHRYITLVFEPKE